jgi:putative ABC transport system substrate-binding protein
MERRTFLGGLALGALVAPRGARAQSARKVHKIGILGFGAIGDHAGPQPRSLLTAGLLRGLRELGYVYGEHFVIEARMAEDRFDRFPDLAAELVRLQVDVIVAVAPALPALQQATSSIAVVMAGVQDPVGQGLARSLGRPGGNFTGVSTQSFETSAKRLEFLKELVPGAAPVAVLWDQLNLPAWQATEAAARERGWRLVSLEIREAGEIERALKTATAGRAGALLVAAQALLFRQAQRVAELATRSRLPAMYGLRHYVEAGGLISYGPDIPEIFRRSAVFVDKILKGAKPGDLPIEQPTKFELVINLEAAKSIGLKVPQALLARADEVIR